MVASVLLMSLGLTVPPDGNTALGGIGESLEWLCACADVVVVGQVVSAEDLGGTGKSAGLMRFELRGKSLGAFATQGTFSVGVRRVSLERLNQLRDHKTELVVFLRRTQQAFTHGGVTVDLWPLRTAARGHWVVPLSSLEMPLMSAAGGAVVNDAGTLNSVCSASMRPVGVPSYPKPPKAYLPLPAEAPLVKTLGAGAPKHLIVPASRFPSAPTTAPKAP